MLLQGLPLKEDMEENETVFKCIVKLITAKNPVVSGPYFGAWASTHISTVMLHHTCTIYSLYKLV